MVLLYTKFLYFYELPYYMAQGKLAEVESPSVAELREKMPTGVDSFVSFEDDIPVVDWEGFVRYDVCDPHDRASRFLMSVGVFSTRFDENYLLMDTGPLVLNPTLDSRPMFFTQEDDARRYREVKYETTRSPPTIIQARRVKD